ncbi:MAG: ribosome silencing factor [Cytophagales bacterium]
MAKRKSTKVLPETKLLLDLVVKGMQERKAKNITILDMSEVSGAMTDFFVICTGTSDSQVDAISDSIEEEVYNTVKYNPAHVEGKANKEWILIDYLDVMAHVFKKETREFFALEDLWGDAKITKLEDVA